VNFQKTLLPNSNSSYRWQIPLSWIVALMLLLLNACSNRQSAYDTGPLGPKDPIFWSWKAGQGPRTTYLPTAEPPSHSRNAPGQAGGNQKLAPPRKTIPNHFPAETFGTAAGQTQGPQTLDPFAASQLRKEIKK
jgi:hypothetical protein